MTTLWASTTRHHHTENLSGEFGKYLSTLIHRLRGLGVIRLKQLHVKGTVSKKNWHQRMSSKEDHCTALPKIEHSQCKSQLKATTLFFYAKWDQLKKTMIIRYDFSNSPKCWEKYTTTCTWTCMLTFVLETKLKLSRFWHLQKTTFLTFRCLPSWLYFAFLSLLNCFSLPFQQTTLFCQTSIVFFKEAAFQLRDYNNCRFWSTETKFSNQGNHMDVALLFNNKL